MCGIVGYVGPKPALGVVMDGLRRLEYRGYDSAGVAVVTDAGLTRSGISVQKRAGKLVNLEKALAQHPMPPAHTAIGHTRWATHGAPNDANAHPHVSAAGDVAVVHNGIIENFMALRTELEAVGIEMSSETDTEVIAHLLSQTYVGLPVGPGRLAEALRVVCRRLIGAFTLVAVHAELPGTVVAARRDSPLVAGGSDGEYFLASDVAAFLEYTREALHFGQDQVIEIDRERGMTVTDFDGALCEPTRLHVDWDIRAAEKGGHAWFMLKEIAEQPTAVADTLRGRLSERGTIELDEVRLTEQDLRDVDKVFIVACGTAYNAGLVAKYAIEHWTRIPCEVELSSEFRYRDPVLDRSTLVIAISQSGETMDTLKALRHAKEQRARVLAICNTNGATIPRESDAVLYTRAGPEIAVASTKGFLTQLAACYVVALHLAQVRGTKYGDEVTQIIDELMQAPQQIEATLASMEPVRALARELAGVPTMLFLGRHVGYPIALEGALKLKELAYIHAEGFAAGELKHGPIALIDSGTPVVIIVPSPRGRDSLHGKIVSNIAEVRARGACTIVIAEEGDEGVVPFADHLIRVPALPTLLAPLVTTLPLQVLACEIADKLGLDVDQPRNLAKSVTVE